MRKLNLCIMGYIAYVGLRSLSFIIDALMGKGGSGGVSERLWLPILTVASIFILFGTISFLSKFLPKMNKLILAILGVFVSLLQVLILNFVFFVLAVSILAPILGRSGFHITMP